MSTGIRILPRDSVGYMFDGIPVTYQLCRRMQEDLATRYPELRAGLALQAEGINGIHLRRLLRAATWGKIDDRFGIENMPRALRRAWNRFGVPTSGSFSATDEYVLAIDKNRRAIARSLRAMTE